MRYQVQYAIVACIFAAMVAWSFFTARCVSTAQALMDQQQLLPAQKEAMDECAQIQTKLSELSKQADMLTKLDSRLVVADVLAELSFLVDSRILMTEIDMQAEGFDETGTASGAGAGLVKPARNVSGSQQSLAGDVRYKVVLRGMACDAGDTARLICKLEESPYFCEVIPGFSKTTKIKDLQVSEFEIGCYIANYKELR
jgi:hypothetical protein